MAKYKCLNRVKTSDGVIHSVGETIELNDQEAEVCLEFNAVVLVPDPHPAQPKIPTETQVQQAPTQPVPQPGATLQAQQEPTQPKADDAQ